MTGRARGIARVVALALAVPWSIGATQGVRISGTTWVQSIDLRPLRQDSVLASDVAGEGNTRRRTDGQLVHCATGAPYCYFNTSGTRETTTPLLQDLSVAAWGMGEGVSAHAHLRGRLPLGGESALWPRLGDRFDALEAYVQVERRRGRLQLGRLWATHGLGAYNYDGGAVQWRQGAHSVEVYGGRALVQGLNEPYTSDEIGAIDDIPPEAQGYLVGVRMRVRPSDLTAATLVYQRTVAGDRSALYSERVALDATTITRGVALDGSVAYDVAGGALNEARVRATRRLGDAFALALEGRHHRPFFELWTIWGAFAPVGFDEGRAELSWQTPGGSVQLAGHGAYRTYRDAETGVGFLPLRSDGWRAGADALWRVDDAMVASARYAVDIGFGASRSDVSVGARWAPRDGVTLGATTSAFQSIYEFRVGTGRVLGVTVDGGLRLTPDWRIAGDAGVYHHRLTNDAPGTNWSQRRAAVRLEWTVGGDPGFIGGVR